MYHHNNGYRYATDRGSSGKAQIDRVDLVSGDRTVVAGDGVGGTTFGSLTGIAVYPSPTPPQNPRA